jgi:hypothetical protein
MGIEQQQLTIIRPKFIHNLLICDTAQVKLTGGIPTKAITSTVGSTTKG